MSESFGLLAFGYFWVASSLVLLLIVFLMHIVYQLYREWKEHNND